MSDDSQVIVARLAAQYHERALRDAKEALKRAVWNHEDATARLEAAKLVLAALESARASGNSSAIRNDT